MIKVNDPIFCSDYSQALWSVLGLGLDELCEFILTGKVFENRVLLDPIAILKHFEVLKKQKPLMYTGTMKVASDYLSSCYTKYSPFNAKGELLPLPMYCSALYLQLKRLSHKYDVSSALSKRGGISGISNNGVTPKDFMDRFTTGSKKLIYGNPYVYEQFVKGEGKVKHLLNKACGQLEIQLAISLDKAKELHKMIENAGVSTFYLGKKGLAYVSAIEI